MIGGFFGGYHRALQRACAMCFFAGVGAFGLSFVLANACQVLWHEHPEDSHWVVLLHSWVMLTFVFIATPAASALCTRAVRRALSDEPQAFAAGAALWDLARSLPWVLGVGLASAGLLVAVGIGLHAPHVEWLASVVQGTLGVLVPARIAGEPARRLGLRRAFRLARGEAPMAVFLLMIISHLHRLALPREQPILVMLAFGSVMLVLTGVVPVLLYHRARERELGPVGSVFD